MDGVARSSVPTLYGAIGRIVDLRVRSEDELGVALSTNEAAHPAGAHALVLSRRRMALDATRPVPGTVVVVPRVPTAMTLSSVQRRRCVASLVP